MDRSQRRVLELYDVAGLSDGCFWSLTPVRRHINERISGDPAVSWVDHVVQRFLGAQVPLSRCLSLCCGRGHLERSLAQRGVFVSCDAFDISYGSIADAKKLALDAGFANIHYTQCDVNQIELEADEYDAVFVNAGMHHIENLEGVYGEVHRSLRSGGWFVLNEYVGPAQFQFTDRQLEVMNAALRILPHRYRHSVRQRRILARDTSVSRHSSFNSLPALLRRVWEKARSGRLLSALRRRLDTELKTRRGEPVCKERIERPTVGEMNLWNPSEAIRSAEIIPLLRDSFEIVEIKPWGGTVFNFLLDDIAGNFDPARDKDMRMLDLVFRIEDTLIECGDLESDFALVVAKKSPA